MNISISNIAWKNEEEPAVASLLQEMGVRGVDIAYTKRWRTPSDPTPAVLRQYRAFWENHGIAIIGMQSLIYGRPDLGLFSEPDVRGRMINYLIEVFRLAGALGARPLVFGSPQNRLKSELSDRAAQAIAVEFFGRLAAAAQREDVVLCIEPNPAAYGCDFVQTTAAALELVKRVDHPHFRLHLDTAIMTMNGEVIEDALESAIGVLAHVHISEPELGLVGEGVVDHARFADALRRLRYKGWLAIEMRRGSHRSDLESVRKALAFSRKVYFD